MLLKDLLQVVKYFIKISGVFNERVHARYRNCLVGDSPEMARGLDSYGFSDLMVSVKFHVALTYKLGRDNNKIFQLGTPREVSRCIDRCWQVEPTAKRVLDDIESWEFALDQIISANGTVVHGLALRHGHRANKRYGTGKCKNRVSNSQRKDLLFARPVHNDALHSFNHMAGIMADIEDRAMLIEVIERAQQNELELTLESFVEPVIISDDEEEEQLLILIDIYLALSIYFIIYDNF